jgi:phosphoribosylaminoimidazole carboxylase (NCAIR synthetase)
VKSFVGADTGRTIHTAEWLSGRPEPAQLDEMIAQLARAATDEVIRRLGVQGVMPV